MKKQVILLAFGLSLSAVTSAFAAGRSHDASERRAIEKPVPVSVVQPVVSTRYIGERINLVFHLDEQGRPNRIASTSRVAKDLVGTLIAAVSQWEFTPARDANGAPRTAKVLLPVRITEPRP